MLHHPDEFTEEVLGIVGSWGGLGVILNRKDRQCLMSHSFTSLVIQIDLSQFDLFRVQGTRVHTESMILGSDHNSSCFQIFNGLVCPPVTEFQFKGLSSQG